MFLIVFVQVCSGQGCGMVIAITVLLLTQLIVFGKTIFSIIYNTFLNIFGRYLSTHWYRSVVGGIFAISRLKIDTTLGNLKVVPKDTNTHAFATFFIFGTLIKQSEYTWSALIRSSIRFWMFILLLLQLFLANMAECSGKNHRFFSWLPLI